MSVHQPFFFWKSEALLIRARRQRLNAGRSAAKGLGIKTGIIALATGLKYRNQHFCIRPTMTLFGSCLEHFVAFSGIMPTPVALQIGYLSFSADLGHGFGLMSPLSFTSYGLDRVCLALDTGLREKPADIQSFVAAIVPNWDVVANYVCLKALQTLASRKGQLHAARIVVQECSGTG